MKAKTVLAITWCLFGSVFVVSQAAPQQPPSPEQQVTATAIPGVIAAGTKVERVWTGLQAGDGLIGQPDGTLLLPEQGTANRVSKFDIDGNVTIYLEDTNEAGGIAIDPMGRIIDIERSPPSRVRILVPERRVLADAYEGNPFERLSDIVADRKGGVYVTESPTSSVFYIRPDGTVTRVADDIERANGIMLSPDELTLYVTNTPNGILAYDVQPDSSIRNRRLFVKPEGGQDGLATDAAGRLYVAGQTGVQVFSSEGQQLGLIPTPRPTTTLAFAGPDKKTLYVIGRGNDGPGGDGRTARSMYKISMQAEGFKGRAK
jgi:gluconolactonase